MFRILIRECNQRWSKETQGKHFLVHPKKFHERKIFHLLIMKWTWRVKNFWRRFYEGNEQEMWWFTFFSDRVSNPKLWVCTPTAKKSWFFLCANTWVTIIFERKIGNYFSTVKFWKIKALFSSNISSGLIEF